MCLTHSPFVHTPTEPEADDKLSKHKAMVRYTDRLVGRLTKALDDLGLRDNTIIVFTTDNGTSGAITGTRNGEQVRGAKADKHEPGVCQPFIVNGPGIVPVGVTNALTDFTDLLPTFCDLAGVDVPEEWPVDGHSFAPLIRGEADDSPRDWILAMGHGAAILDDEGVRPKVDFAQRVIRDKRYKVWVDEQRQIDQLYDLSDDPYEEQNLIDSDDAEHRHAIAKFQKVVAEMPETDARPRYRKREALPWDKET